MNSISSPQGSLTLMDSPMRTSDVKSDHDGDSERQQNSIQFLHIPLQRSIGTNNARILSWSDAESPRVLNDLFMSDTEPEYYHPALFSPQASQIQEKFRVLGTLGLTGLAFFMSCGGPIGSEPLMSAGGPLVGLIAVPVYVLCCVFPFLYVVAELVSTFPDNGGYTVWIMTVFGPFWGFQIGCWSWLACALNNAIYPGLMYTTIAGSCGWSNVSSVVEYFIKLSIAFLLAIPSLLSVRFVAAAAFVLLIVIAGLVLLFSVWGFSNDTHDWSMLLDVRDSSTVESLLHKQTNGSQFVSVSSGVDWGLLVNTLFWNFDGLYDSSIISGEVVNPAKTYPHVFFINVSAMLALYLIPLVSAVTATSDRLSWLYYNENSFPTIARVIGGTTLHTLIQVLSVLSITGLFTTSIFLQSFQVLGMAHMRLLPAAFRTRHKTFQTPQYAVLLGMLTTMILLLFDYESILGLTNAFSAGSQVLIVLTMLQLRRVLPHITRPIKVPGPFPVVCVVLVPVSGVFLYILFHALTNTTTALVFCGLLMPGIAYGVGQRQRVRQELRQRAIQHQQELLATVLPTTTVS